MSQRYKFQFPPGQEPELVPELTDDEKCAVFDRFSEAFTAYIREHRMYGIAITALQDIFYAGYKAGYGHAKDDAQAAMEAKR